MPKNELQGKILRIFVKLSGRILARQVFYPSVFRTRKKERGILSLS